MLQIKNICKKYITGELEQTALNDVSLNLRENEFVAILGQSGSGKTTLLNVIGGLDRYDSGDLIINGISTKNYDDRDWDSYRNHTIGFVFQSYNLIPHQTVLSNVELALTISGISGAEKRERAKKALEQVGLGNQLHKKPNQMSGGQMQRVAIARALVNNPDILLADEPTGALDSETSIQVMDLLKEVAKDRLVVMVTHNPELAEDYATRIVKLSDGKIIDDSNPFIVDEAEMAEPTHQNMGKSSMSFLTSLALSFNNLKTKKGRTILTSFAGSIGIIGIALILSLSNGVNTYIHNIEEDTLSEYPVTIASTDMDLTSMIAMAAEASVDEEAGEEVNERKTISSFFSTSKKNDLKSLRAYLESDDCDIYNYSTAIEYSFMATPQIYRVDDHDFRRVNPNESFAELNRTYGAMAANMPYNIFSALPENESLYKEQYNVIEGRWPENSHELILVLSPDNCITDVALYAMGIKDDSELDKMIKDYRDGKIVNEVSEMGKYKFSDFLGKKFKLVDICKTYQYDSKREMYVDKSDDETYMQNLFNDSVDLEIVGIVKRDLSSKAGMLNQGVLYPYELQAEIINQSAQSDIVQAQLKHPDIDVFTGKPFDDESKDNPFESMFDIDTSGISNAFGAGSGFGIDSSLFNNIDFSNIQLDFSDMEFDLSGAEDIDWATLLSNINIEVNQEALRNMFNSVLQGYLNYASSDPSTDYSKLPDAIGEYLKSDTARQIITSNISDIISRNPNAPTAQETTALVSDLVNGFGVFIQQYPDADMSQISTYINMYLNSAEVQQKILAFVTGHDFNTFSQADVDKIMGELANGYKSYAVSKNLPDPTKMRSSFEQYIQSAEGKQLIQEGINSAVNVEELEKQFGKLLTEAMGSYSSGLEKQIGKIMQSVMKQIGGQIGSSMSSAFSGLSSLFNFNPDTFANMFKFDMDPTEFQEIMMTMMTEGSASYEGNLSKLNYRDLEDPSQILIFPKDFDNKTEIIDILNKYNKRMEKEDKDKVIGFTDYVATLMSSVTDIIDTISYVLIAFVAISLVVSSIMIGIITYISVLERTKEIGILRAIGASKPNISQVFNAETFIIGLFAGILGIVITLLLLIPGNMLIHHLTNGTNVNAILPIGGAIILIIISVILTLIGGIIPSRAAAKKDPVTALRSE